jgi:hypothetical protein
MRRDDPMRLTTLVLLSAALVSLGPTARAENRLVAPAQYLTVTAGLGYSFPFDRTGDDEDASGTGFSVGGEYALGIPVWWISPRGYAGFLFTFPDNGELCRARRVDCDVSAKIGILGAKIRFTIPIPYVAPFLEFGIGASIGAMRTRTLKIHEEMSGITHHIPFAIGLSLGEAHNVDLSFAYLIHPSEKQIGGGIVAGLTFVLHEAVVKAE